MTEMRLLQIPGWQQFPWLRHGFTTRAGGVSKIYGENTLNLGWTAEDSPEAVRENRRLLVSAVQRDASPAQAMKLVTVRQVHSNRIHPIKAEDAFAGDLETTEGKAVLEGDGLITNEPGALLAAGTADCVPVLIVDPRLRAVGAFHAGWRGTAARIVEHGVEAMRKEYGSRPADLLAAIGPSIGPCCYTVGEEVQKKFEAEFSYGQELLEVIRDAENPPVLKLNLWKANRRQLEEAGLKSGNITIAGQCTACTFEPSGQRVISLIEPRAAGQDGC